MVHYRITSRTTPTRSLRSGQQPPTTWHSGHHELRPSRSLEFNRNLSSGVYLTHRRHRFAQSITRGGIAPPSPLTAPQFALKETPAIFAGPENGMMGIVVLAASRPPMSSHGLRGGPGT
jgi:hypothetical protein